MAWCKLILSVLLHFNHVITHYGTDVVSCDGGFVHHRTYLTLYVERAGGGPLSLAARFAFVAVASVLDESGVVPTDNSLDIQHTVMAELDCVPVQDSLQSILPLWVEMLVKQA